MQEIPQGHNDGIMHRKKDLSRTSGGLSHSASVIFRAIITGEIIVRLEMDARTAVPRAHYWGARSRKIQPELFGSIHPAAEILAFWNCMELGLDGDIRGEWTTAGGSKVTVRSSARPSQPTLSSFFRNVGKPAARLLDEGIAVPLAYRRGLV